MITSDYSIYKKAIIGLYEKKLDWRNGNFNFRQEYYPAFNSAVLKWQYGDSFYAFGYTLPRKYYFMSGSYIKYTGDQ